MANRTLAVLSFLTAALASPLTFADNDGFRALNNEAGSQFVGQTGSTMTRDDVKRGLQPLRRDGSWRLTEASVVPMASTPRAGFMTSREEVRQAAALRGQAASSTGWRDIGGEGGWVFEGR